MAFEDHDIYVMEQPMPDSHDPADTEFVASDDSNWAGWERCSYCNGYLGPKVWAPPFKAHLECFGKEVGDVAHSVGDELLISERFAALLKDHSFPGLEVIGRCTISLVKWPRRRIKKLRTATPSYFVARILRGRTAIDAVRSNLLSDGRPTCLECRNGGNISSFERIMIDPRTRDNLDVFILRGLPGIFMCTQKFRNFCLEHKMTNVRFIPAEEYSWYPLGKPEV